MRILVTGGAGYIGSVVAEQLILAGHTVVVFDNLSQGHREAVPPDAVFVRGDLADRTDVARLLDQHAVDAVMHFASHALVGESVQRPFLYIGDNVVNGLNLLRAALDHDVRRFVLSSTCNVFGHVQRVPIDEDEGIFPGSPYGESKYLLERILAWLDRTAGLRYAVLRYFNAAGATSRYGEDHAPETHLIPIVLQTALGQRERIEIFGGDYPTADGTCVRDYIHVLDLAQAHMLALDALEERSCLYNLGNGRGFSVHEVIEMARRITGQPIPAILRPRRPGDPATLIADSTRIRAELGWEPGCPDLRDIIQSAWDWHRTHPRGYAACRVVPSQP